MKQKKHFNFRSKCECSRINFCACNMLAKNWINRNKMDNKAEFDNRNIDFTLFIQNDINGCVEFE